MSPVLCAMLLSWTVEVTPYDPPVHSPCHEIDVVSGEEMRDRIGVARDFGEDWEMPAVYLPGEDMILLDRELIDPGTPEGQGWIVLILTYALQERAGKMPKSGYESCEARQRNVGEAYAVMNTWRAMQKLDLEPQPPVRCPD